MHAICACKPQSVKTVLGHTARRARRQVRDKWGFRMTARLDMYAELLTRAARPDFEPQIIRDPAL